MDDLFYVRDAMNQVHGDVMSCDVYDDGLYRHDGKRYGDDQKANHDDGTGYRNDASCDGHVDNEIRNHY